MYCGKCGFQVNENEAFCPNCGAKMAADAAPEAAAPAEAAPETEPAAPVTAPAAPAAPKKKKKKGLLTALIAAALALSIIAGVVFAPMLTNYGYGKNNVFADSMSDVPRGSDERETLEFMAALQNTLFDTGSMTFVLTGYGDPLLDGKVVLGENLFSSGFYMNIDSDCCMLVRNGTFLFADGYDSLEVRVPDILESKNQLLRTGNGLFDVIKTIFTAGEDAGEDSFFGWADGALTDLYNFMTSIDDYLNNIVQDNRLSYEVVNDLSDLISTDAFSLALSDLTGEKAEDGKDLETWNKMLADFIVTCANGLFRVEKTKNGKKTEYRVSVEPSRMFDTIADYVSANATAREAFGDAAMDSVIGELRSTAMSLAGMTVYLMVTVEKKYITDVRLSDRDSVDDPDDCYRLAITRINDTEITEEEEARVRDFVAQSKNYALYNSIYDFFRLLKNMIF